MRVTLVVLFAAVVIAMAATPAPAATIHICSQIKNGPYTAYTSVLGHHLKGRTWTIFSTGVPCGVANQIAPTVLTWWRANKGGGATIIPGFTCSREDDRGYSGAGAASGGAGCVTGKYGPNANITVRMTGPYTVAQLRHLVGG